MRNQMLTTLMLATVVTLTATSSILGDTVHLQDGSRLHGSIQRVADGQLTIDTDFAGKLTIPADRITALATDEERTVQLTSGDRIVGRLSITDDDTQQMTDTSFGTVTLDPAEIESLWGTDQPSPVTREQRQQHQQEIEKIEKQNEQQVSDLKQQISDLESQASEYEDPWSFRLEFGLNGETGNNERLGFTGDAVATRELPNERLTFDLRGRYSEENGERSTNEIKGGMKIEVDVSETWFVFGKWRMEFDEFENLDLRSTVSAGIGHFFIEEEKQELKGRAGIGYQHESFMDGTTNDQAVLELGYDYRLDVNSWLRFTHSLTYYPSFDDPAGDFRIEAETAGEMPLSNDKAWRLRTGVRNEYDSEPRPGVENLDTYYFMNLVYDWE